MAKKVLEGIKVISMGSAWAGPYIGRLLAELGAEVFRVAYIARPPPGGGSQAVNDWKESIIAKGVPRDSAEKVSKVLPSYLAPFQASNMGLGIDLRNPNGKEVYKKLIEVTDIVIDGWSPRVMAKLGLDYRVIKEINPKIIYVSIPALGMTGPDKDVRMWGSGCGALGGLASLRGYRDGNIYPSPSYLADPISGMHILVAILASLSYRYKNGEGQHIDISQTEIATVILGEALMDYSMNKRIAKPVGNRHPYFAPHGCYQCKGEDKWASIAVTSEDEWCYLCDTIGKPELANEPKYADMLSRWHNEEEIDRLIEEWTIQHDHYVVQEILQRAGVPAAAVVTIPEQINNDLHIKDRNVYQQIRFHDGVIDNVVRAPFILPRTPTSPLRVAPYTGQHNDYVLGEILGISKDEIAKLVEEKVIGSQPST